MANAGTPEFRQRDPKLPGEQEMPTAPATSAAELTNWAGNVRFGANRFHQPSTVAALQQIISRSSKVRVLGTGHSFNEIADTTGDLISTSALPNRIDLDSDRRAVLVSGGTRFAELGSALQAAGLAIPNTGSLPHISVAGASATGTHGSGDRLRNLSNLASAIEMITADGELVTLSRSSDGERFDGVVLALGALGVITTMTLDIVPTFTIRQDVYDAMADDDYRAHFDEIMASGYSVSSFSTWKAPRTQQVWVKSLTSLEDREPAAPAWHGATLAPVDRHPLAGMPVEHATQQLGVPGPWNERLPHFRLDFTPSSGEEVQSEFMVPRDWAVEALRSLDDIADQVASVLQVAEIRTVAADTLWLSPSSGVDTVCLHFTWIKDERAIAPVIKAIEERLAAFDARPHWGKRFYVAPAEIERLYPKLPDFRSLMSDLDPGGKFRNEWISRNIAGDSGAH